MMNGTEYHEGMMVRRKEQKEIRTELAVTSAVLPFINLVKFTNTSGLSFLICFKGTAIIGVLQSLWSLKS